MAETPGTARKCSSHRKALAGTARVWRPPAGSSFLPRSCDTQDVLVLALQRTLRFPMARRKQPSVVEVNEVVIH